MKRETVLALNALNQAFYAAIAPEWSESRKLAWPGFERVFAPFAVPTALPTTPRRPLRVFDVGAGDGRFAAWLADRSAEAERRFEYLGIDASAALLAHARNRALGAHVRFEQHDFLLSDPPLPGGAFDLVLLLGVLHHVPSFALRRALLAQLAQRVAAGGRLALTFWRLDADARFARRVRPWSDYNARAGAAIDEADLEPGDTLLAWSSGDALRYCHFPDAAETEALIAATGLPVVERFRADGRGGALNEYVVLGTPFGAA